MIAKTIIGALLGLAVAAAAQAADDETLRVLTHSSFDIDGALLARFEQQSGVKVEIIKAGDAGEALNKLILTKDAPVADVVYGIDNLLVAKAEAAGVLDEYVSPAAAGLPDRLRLGSRLTPVDYGYVTLNYDKAKIGGGPLPADLNDLAKPAWKDKLVIENPATSSPGLAFLAATVRRFGEPAVWTFWAALRDNGVKVDDGWTAAYEKDFSRNGGTRPLVLSYGTSPAAEVFYADDKPTDSPTANLFLPGASFLQVEGAGLVHGGKLADKGKAFVDFLLSAEVQADIPTRMWVYPVVPGLPLDATFKFAAQPDDAAPFTATDADEIKGWVTKWSRIVLRGQAPE